MISGLKSKNYEERCAESGIQTLADRRLDQDLAQVFRYSKNVGNIGTEKMFETAAARDGATTRQSGAPENFKLPAARLDIRKNSFAVCTVQRWNELPSHIKSSRNCEAFKQDLKIAREWWEAATEQQLMSATAGHPRERAGDTATPLHRRRWWLTAKVCIFPR
jgi:hypothetical protein